MVTGSAPFVRTCFETSAPWLELHLNTKCNAIQYAPFSNSTLDYRNMRTDIFLMSSRCLESAKEFRNTFSFQYFHLSFFLYSKIVKLFKE